MFLINYAIKFIFPEKNNKIGFGRLTKNAPKKTFGEKIQQPCRSNRDDFGYAKNHSFQNRSFGKNKNNSHKLLTLSQSTREANAQKWGMLTSHQNTIHRSVTVTKRIEESDDMLSLELSFDDQKGMAFKAGQFLTCFLKTNANNQTIIKRAYSLSSAPSSGQIAISVKKLSGGIASQFIHEQLKEGDQFDVSGPSGSFITHQADTNTHVFIAAGSGITPIKSQIDELLSTSTSSSATETPNIVLIYGNRTVRSTAFNNHFKSLARKHKNLTIINVLSKSNTSKKSYKGQIDKALLEKIMQTTDIFDNEKNNNFESTRFYVCGPEGLITNVSEYLRALNIPINHIKFEHFLPAAQATCGHPKQAEQIHFLRSNKKVLAQPGETILEAGLRAGLPLKHSCQVGGCGHCKVPIHSGEVISDEPNCLSSEELKQGYRLACLSYPNSPTEIDA